MVHVYIGRKGLWFKPSYAAAILALASVLAFGVVPSFWPAVRAQASKASTAGAPAALFSLGKGLTDYSVTADEIDVDSVSGTMTAKGHVVLEAATMVLRADLVVVSSAKSAFSASGNVRLSDPKGETVLTCGKLDGTYQPGRLVAAQNVVLTYRDGRVAAGRLEYSETDGRLVASEGPKYEVGTASLEGDSFEASLSGRTVKVSGNVRLTSETVTATSREAVYDAGAGTVVLLGDVVAKGAQGTFKTGRLTIRMTSSSQQQ